MFTNIWNFISRHAVWLLLLILPIWALSWNWGNIINTLLYATSAVGLTIGLSSLSLYAYTIIPFSSKIIFGDDGKLNSVEAHAFMRFAGQVLIAVAIVVGCVIIGFILQNS